jgi:hypothetical protein
VAAPAASEASPATSGSRWSTLKQIYTSVDVDLLRRPGAGEQLERDLVDAHVR